MLKMSDVVLACGTRLVDVEDVSRLLAVRGHAMHQVQSFKFNSKDDGYEKEGVRFSIPGWSPQGPEVVYADRDKAYAIAIHAAEQMVERFKAERAKESTK